MSKLVDKLKRKTDKLGAEVGQFGDIAPENDVNLDEDQEKLAKREAARRHREEENLRNQKAHDLQPEESEEPAIDLTGGASDFRMH